MKPREKIRILEIIRGLDIGGINGGAERFSIDLARALPKDRYEVSLCVFFKHNNDNEKRWIDSIERAEIPIFFVSEWEGKNHFDTYLRGMINLKKTLQVRPVDICHSHFQLGNLGALFLKLQGLAQYAVRTAHLVDEWDKGWYGWLREQLFSGWIYPIFFDAEVGVSQAIVDRLAKNAGTKIGRRPPRLIYNAISFDGILSPGEERRPAERGGKYIVGTVGRLMPQKGHIYLLHAIKKALCKLPRLECWMIGDGDLRIELEETCRQLSLEEAVLFMGRRGDVPDLLRQMDLFVLPSLWEGLPTVLMESMACGTPVLATDIPGSRDLVEESVNGWLVPVKDSDQLADKIIDALLHPEERQRVAKNAYSMLNRYSMDHIVKQYQDLFESMQGY